MGGPTIATTLVSNRTQIWAIVLWNLLLQYINFILPNVGGVGEENNQSQRFSYSGLYEYEEIIIKVSLQQSDKNL